MDFNKLTQKSQQAVQRAQEVAVRYGHQELDGEHLLLALVDEPEGLVPRLFQKMDVAVDSKGRIYVVDTVRLHIRVFAPDEPPATTQPAASEGRCCPSLIT